MLYFFAESDKNVLVSRAVNLNIDGFTLKPAGKQHSDV